MPAATTTPPAPGPHLVRIGAGPAVPARSGPPSRETPTAGPAVVPLPLPVTAAAAPAAPLLRVERGAATPEEIAAVTAVLLARAASARAGAGTDEVPAPRRPAARWRLHGFAGPRAWTSDARDLLAG